MQAIYAKTALYSILIGNLTVKRVSDPRCPIPEKSALGAIWRFPEIVKYTPKRMHFPSNIWFRGFIFRTFQFIAIFSKTD
jgi:hypothetical protein